MSGTLNRAADCFELFEGGVPVAFMAVLHQPTTNRLPLKRVSRLVVLPDYQGIGIGRAFLDAIADLYVQEGFLFEIRTSARNLASSLRNDPRWAMRSYGRTRDTRTQKRTMGGTHRTACKCATFLRVSDDKEARVG